MNFFIYLQVAGSIIGKGGQNITKLRSQVSIFFVLIGFVLRFRKRKEKQFFCTMKMSSTHI